MKKRWIVIALSMIVCSMFLLSGCKINLPKELYESGDFIYSLNVDGDKLYLEDLSEQGKQKETIIIPKKIDGFSVTQYTYPAGIVGYHGSFESENLKQIYILPNISIYTIYCNFAPNVEKIILIGTDNDLSYLQLNSNEKTKIYLCRAGTNQLVNDEGYIGKIIFGSQTAIIFIIMKERKMTDIIGRTIMITERRSTMYRKIRNVRDISSADGFKSRNV